MSVGLLDCLGIAGCSVIVGGRIVKRVADCTGQDDGTACSAGDYCFAETCGYSFCGDGIVNAGRGEECDDGNLLGGDGCQPVSCTHTCDGDSPCVDDGNPCNGPESCAAATHVCLSGPTAGAIPCTVNSISGTCGGGLCVPPGCGAGTVVSPEECDPPGGGCMSNCIYDCEQDIECPVSDPCVMDRHCDVGTHLCQDLPPLNCDDGDPCTSDGCSAGVGGCFKNPIDVDGDGYAPMDVCWPGSPLLPKD